MRGLKHVASNVEPLRGVIIPKGLLDRIFACWRKQNKGQSKKIVQLFADFSLFAPVSTHIVLERRCKRATTNRGTDKEKSRRKSGNTMQKDTMEKKQRKKKQSAPNEFDTLCKDLKD